MNQAVRNAQPLMPRSMTPLPIATAVPNASVTGVPIASVMSGAIALPRTATVLSADRRVVAVATSPGKTAVRPSSVRRSPPRRRKPSPEELEAHFRELEAFKRTEERRKKDSEKQHKQQTIQEKRNLHQNLQQATKEANARQAEVDRLLRQLEKVEHEQERQSSRKFTQQERQGETLRKLREEKYTVEQQYECKLGEAGEARGRLDAIEGVMALRNAANKALTEEPADRSEDPLERAEQEMLKSEMSQMRTRIHFLSTDNGRLRQELADLRRAVAVRRSQAADGTASTLALKVGEVVEARPAIGTSSFSPVMQSGARSTSSLPGAEGLPMRSLSTPVLLDAGGVVATPLLQNQFLPIAPIIGTATSLRQAPQPALLPVSNSRQATPLASPTGTRRAWSPPQALPNGSSAVVAAVAASPATQAPLNGQTPLQSSPGTAQAKQMLPSPSLAAAGAGSAVPSTPSIVLESVKSATTSRSAAWGAPMVAGSQNAPLPAHNATAGWAHLRSAAVHQPAPDKGGSSGGDGFRQVVKDATVEALREYRGSQRS